MKKNRKVTFYVVAIIIALIIYGTGIHSIFSLHGSVEENCDQFFNAWLDGKTLALEDLWQLSQMMFRSPEEESYMWSYGSAMLIEWGERQGLVDSPEFIRHTLEWDFCEEDFPEEVKAQIEANLEPYGGTEPWYNTCFPSDQIRR